MNITNESQEVISFLADDHKASTKQDRNNINDQQKKHRLGTFSKNILLEGLNKFYGSSYRSSLSIYANLLEWSIIPYKWCIMIKKVFLSCLTLIPKRKFSKVIDMKDPLSLDTDILDFQNNQKNGLGFIESVLGN